MENTTTLKRAYAWHRPYYINGKQLESIVIYDNNGIILKTRSGWLEGVNKDFSHNYDGDLLELTINGDIKRANKENFNRKDNYIMKGCRDYSFEKGYILYIFVDNIFKNYVELEKVHDKYGNVSDDFYLYGYQVELLYPAVIHDHYLKHYKKGDLIEECDRGRSFSPDLIKVNGKYVDDPAGGVHCLRCREKNKSDFVFYNGLYIREGK